MNSKVNEMWTALAAYQSKADANGHGESWAIMCSEKTTATAYLAEDAAWDAEDNHAARAAYDAAEYTAYAARAVADAAYHTYAEDITYAQQSIDYITKATGTESSAKIAMI